jgi:hypothetical protein
MPTIETSIDVEAPVAVVFDLAQDYRLRLAWDPFLRELRVDGNRAWVKARNGMSMTVEYVAFDRPHRVAVKMVSPSRLFERFAGAPRPRPHARRLPLRLRNPLASPAPPARPRDRMAIHPRHAPPPLRPQAWRGGSGAGGEDAQGQVALSVRPNRFAIVS